MMAVDVATSPAFVAGKPRRLFTGPYAIHLGVRGYDVMPDGSRFLMVDTRADQPPAPATHIILVQNWLEELKRRVPAR
jgi:hypothetical protein